MLKIKIDYMENENSTNENPKVLREEGNGKGCENLKCCGGKKIDFSSNNRNVIYSIGLIGALVYFVSTAHSLGAIVLGIFKALVWPALVVFGLMKFLGM